jgi:hypothetical protein
LESWCHDKTFHPGALALCGRPRRRVRAPSRCAFLALAARRRCNPQAGTPALRRADFTLSAA